MSASVRCSPGGEVALDERGRLVLVEQAESRRCPNGSPPQPPTPARVARRRAADGSAVRRHSPPARRGGSPSARSSPHRRRVHSASPARRTSGGCLAGAVADRRPTARDRSHSRQTVRPQFSASTPSNTPRHQVPEKPNHPPVPTDIERAEQPNVGMLHLFTPERYGHQLYRSTGSLELTANWQRSCIPRPCRERANARIGGSCQAGQQSCPSAWRLWWCSSYQGRRSRTWWRAACATAAPPGLRRSRPRTRRARPHCAAAAAGLGAVLASSPDLFRLIRYGGAGSCS